MAEIKLEKVALLEKEVQDLINDFGEKRRKYKNLKNGLRLASICIGAGTSLILGLSFISGISDICKVMGFVLSAISTVITGCINLYNFEEKWKQRSITYLKLLDLKRDLKLAENVDQDEFDNYKKRLSTIMREDSELYLQQFEQKKGIEGEEQND